MTTDVENPPIGWRARAARLVGITALLLGLGGVVAGCGAEGKDLTSGPPPNTAGAPPGGGDPKEYEREMMRIKQGQAGGGGGMPGMPPAPGGAPPGAPGAPR